MGEFIALYWKHIIVGLLVVLVIMLTYFDTIDRRRR